MHIAGIVSEHNEIYPVPEDRVSMSQEHDKKCPAFCLDRSHTTAIRLPKTNFSRALDRTTVWKPLTNLSTKLGVHRQPHIGDTIETSWDVLQYPVGVHKG